MKYSIVYSSKTGNTAQLAQRLRELLGEEAAYCGVPCAQGAEGDLIFVGFWTDKGGCQEEIAEFLRELRGKRVFLFGTAGFGSDPGYFDQILTRVRAELEDSNTVVGSYMCQGKMPAPVRKRYEAMAETDPAKAKFLLDNFDRAMSHPDEADLKGLEQAARAALA